MMGEFPDCEVKVCDFEISRVVLDGTEVHEILGTPEYVAPEILHYEPITLSADMWSLGVTTYVLLTGFSPFGGETDQETFLNISRAQVDFPDELFEDVSEDAKDFVRRLLRRNPKERMSSKQALKHPWLVKARRARQAASKVRPESRIGCATCPSNNSLKSYLSKSREALFEKVMSQGDLRKKTLIHQYNRTRRMCESQMSLCAREKHLRKESAMSRSKEKLYGLKSLSKSQEVLSFYKSVLNLNDEMLNQINKDKENTHLSAPMTKTEEETQHAVTLKTDSPLPLVPSLDDVNETRPTDLDVCLPTLINEPLMPPQSPTSTEAATTSESEISEEEDSVKESESGEPKSRCWDSPEPSDPNNTKAADEEEEEPKFTVAQLISAYNKHQEVITKSSFEVTMRNQRFDNKMGEVFPTGPNALRLFIPDIKIRKSKPRKKKMPRKKTGLPTNPLDLAEEIENLDVEDDEKVMKTTEAKDSGVEERLQPELDVLSDEVEEKRTESLSDRLGVTAPPPKYMRAETSPEPKTGKQLKPPYYMSSHELKQTPLSNVAKTVELFNNYRPDRKSFSSPRSPPSSPEKTRRKSSPPTMKPF